MGWGSHRSILVMQALFLDINGVLVEDRAPIPGAIEVLSEARGRGLTLRFVTNTATRGHGSILRDLREMGFALEAAELFTAPLAARHYLLRHHLRPHLLVHPAIAVAFADLAGDPPDCVLLGDARDGFSYGALNRVFQLVQQGLPLIGIGRNRYFREGGELLLDAGAFLQTIEWAAGIQAVVLGKPSAAFYAELVASTNFSAQHCLMVGDDLEADVIGAMAAGLAGCLVQTGKYQQADQLRLPPQASLIASVAELPAKFAWSSRT
ncbi:MULTISPECIES: TIGR01458 family HAD-type hydrolase [unclassified Synechococcus]|uniref:TIGR01458 family HAD-type hydrolase n=2 Tax=Synechococcaceae TaxID=1890426 RepID=UPI000A71323F|nr:MULTISPECIES: TIGR01458 family HAD-type hydrolase [unclassified Synechococcus]MCT0246694.1 TIGR01458 family HAD-type hydrolase [Synechococcus sp. CS-601]MCT4363534.1 TIGR01458 family HAD-type hydrolase [Candidatus Regnicoccus frigidus MAG-AL1]TWB93912.1 HAD superfamily hydrolase (TIGR01458 family) [Synechococcus sp. Ace-Pa]